MVSSALSEYTVRESSRAKHLRLKLSIQKGLEVIVPAGFDRSRIPEILREKRRWIQSAKGKIDQHAKFISPESDLVLPDHISLRAIGENWRLHYRQGKARWAGAYENGTDQLLIQGNTDNKAACKKALKRWLARKAKTTLIPWLQQISLDNSFQFNRIFIKSQKTRWASCSRHKSISLNLKLLFLPRDLVRYVFLHELCHTIYMNHSQKYWTLLVSKEPDYITIDQELRNAWRLVPSWIR